MSNLKKTNIFKLLVVAAIALSFNMLYYLNKGNLSRLVVNAEEGAITEEFDRSYEKVNDIDSNDLSADEVEELKTYVKLAPKVIVADANEDLPDGEIPDGDTLDLSEEVDASVGSTIGKKLIKKFGKKFVTKKLPRIIYGKLPKAVIKKITLKKFEKAWNDLFLGSVAGIVSEQAYNYMVKNHVPKWAAKSAAAVLYGVIWYYLN